ncbi:MAG: ACT domain-containing protein [Gaiellales bacterium]
MLRRQLRLRPLSGLSLSTLPGRLALAQLPPDAPLPSWATGVLCSVTRTEHELSLVCDEAAVPEGVRVARGWRALEVAGELDLAMTGVLRSLADPLAEAGISIFALSTVRTDYVLVREDDLPAAVGALRDAGHSVE